MQRAFETLQLGPGCVEVGVGNGTHAGRQGQHAPVAAFQSEQALPVKQQQVEGVVVIHPLQQSGQVGLGIHGQMVLVDRATRTVSVKFSSWPAAQNPVYLLDTVRAFAAAGQHLAGLAERAAKDRANLTGPIGVVEGRERGHS